ncbi:MAG: hypothetical protein ACR2FY_21060 [Pirellulaceae bacterium]
MTVRKKTTKCDQNQTQELTPLAGEENPRGAEKPGGFFSLGGAPSDPLAAEKPGGFFSGPTSGGEADGSGPDAERAPGREQSLGQAGSLPHAGHPEECEELLEKLAAPVPWKKGGRPTVLTPHVREEICKLLSVGLSRRQVGAYLKIDPTTITHAAERDAEFAREIQQAEDLVQVPAMVSLVAASRKNWRAALSLLNRKRPLSEEEKKQRHQERLAAVRRKREVSRLDKLLELEAGRERYLRGKAIEAHDAAAENARQQAEMEQRKKGRK